MPSRRLCLRMIFLFAAVQLTTLLLLRKGGTLREEERTEEGDKAGFVLLVTVDRGERGRREIFFFVVNESRNAETITDRLPRRFFARCL